MSNFEMKVNDQGGIQVDYKIHISEPNYWAVILPDGRVLGCGGLNDMIYSSKEDFLMCATIFPRELPIEPDEYDDLYL